MCTYHLLHAHHQIVIGSVKHVGRILLIAIVLSSFLTLRPRVAQKYEWMIVVAAGMNSIAVTNKSGCLR